MLACTLVVMGAVSVHAQEVPHVVAGEYVSDPVLMPSISPTPLQLDLMFQGDQLVMTGRDASTGYPVDSITYTYTQQRNMIYSGDGGNGFVVVDACHLSSRLNGAASAGSVDFVKTTC
jgi:hypothetical protein